MALQIDLDHRTALVTGSTQGIGFAIAQVLAEAGARVAVNGRSEASVRSAVASLRRAVPEGSFIEAPADVSTAAGANGLLALVPAVDILVNNLGVYGAKPALEITDEDWRTYFEVNVLSAVRLTRSYLPGMTDTGWGRVQFIASDSAIVIPAEMIHYGVSKTALLGVARGFAKAAAGTGVTVNSIIVGPTRSGGVEDFVYSLVDPALPWPEAEAEFMRSFRPQSLLGRLIDPREIGNVVAYLASPLSSATTGGAIRVDGGYVDSILP